MYGQSRPQVPPVALSLLTDDFRSDAWMCYALRNRGYAVKVYPDIYYGRRLFARNHFRLVLVSVNSSHDDREELLGFMRKKQNSPIIVVGRATDDVTQECLLLKSGADDYVRAPCSEDLLVAKVQSVLRRGGHCNAKSAGERPMSRQRAGQVITLRGAG